MVFDGLRNRAYARALAKIVGPDTTVMDLGAGLGMHGLIAARQGARSVHLVEPAPVLDVTRKIAANNDLDNVHYHPCRVGGITAGQPGGRSRLGVYRQLSAHRRPAGHPCFMPAMHFWPLADR